MALRIGIDLGGTKTEIAALDSETGEILLKNRKPTPKDYQGVLDVVKELVDGAEKELGMTGTVGMGIPGTVSAQTGLVKNANATWLIGHPLDKDLAKVLNRPVRIANDADCLAVSEASDGAGKGYNIVWAVILGTGVGSGISAFHHIITGPNSIGGEWGHNPMPWTKDAEMANRECYCGKNGCVETFLSGKALAKEYFLRTGLEKTGAEIAEAAKNGEAVADEVLSVYEERLARATSAVINVIDPDIIVLGGGVSNIDRLYTNVPPLWKKYVFSDTVETKLAKAKFGDSSGVRGAARLWDNP